MQLSESERQEIGARAARIETRTGTQIIAAVIGRCDTYPETPWQAFALCAALAALAVTLSGVLPGVAWPPRAVPPALTFLGAGAIGALAALFVPPFSRLLAGAARREMRARRYAAAFFLAHRLAQTKRRNAILLLVGVFERQVVILPDTGIALDENALQQIIARMKPRLRAGQAAPALQEGLDALEALLVARGFAGGSNEDEIAQEVFEEKGA